MLKYTLISYLILTVAMLYFANKMLGVKDNLEKKVLGSYYSQMEKINEASSIEVYNIDNQTSYEETLRALEEIK